MRSECISRVHHFSAITTCITTVRGKMFTLEMVFGGVTISQLFVTESATIPTAAAVRSRRYTHQVEVGQLVDG